MRDSAERAQSAPPAPAAPADELTLRDYAAVVRRRKWWVIVPAVVVLLAALAWSMSQADRYRATTRVLVLEPPTAYTIGSPQQPMQERALQNELERAQGSRMLDDVRAQVGDEPTLKVRLATADESDVFVFTAESGNADRAAEAAAAYAEVYIEDRRLRLTEEFERNIEVLEDRIAALDEQIEQLSGDSADSSSMIVVQREEYVRQMEAQRTSIDLAESSGASIIDAAAVPSEPFEPKPLRTGLLALFVGLLVGLGAAFLRDYLDSVIRDEDDLRRATGLPLLGVVPRLKNGGDRRIVVLDDPLSPTAESYRGLRTSVQFLRSGGGLKVIQVTSPKPGDGKSTTTCNLAVVCGRAGQRVLVVDCDLRRPAVHEFFGLSNDEGVTSALRGDGTDVVVQDVPSEPNVSVVTSGPIPADPSELLSAPWVSSLLQRLAADYDLVLIDSPPVLPVADPIILAGLVDGVILVASATTTDRRQAARAADLLAQVEAEVLGAVLNAFDPTKSSSYGYTYPYAYANTK